MIYNIKKYNTQYIIYNIFISYIHHLIHIHSLLVFPLCRRETADDAVPEPPMKKIKLESLSEQDISKLPNVSLT